MTESGYPRVDEPGRNVAHGYLHEEGLRTNVLHLPVRGSGDGGAVSTAADLAAFWTSLVQGRIVSPATLEQLTAPLSVVEEEGMPVRPRLLAWTGFRTADPRGLRRGRLRPHLARPGHRRHRLGPLQQLRGGVARARRGRGGVRSPPVSAQHAREEPLRGSDVGMTRAALRGGHALQGLLDVLAAGRPGGPAAGGTGDGSAHLQAVLSAGAVSDCAAFQRAQPA